MEHIGDDGILDIVQIQSHIRAGGQILQIRDQICREIRQGVDAGVPLTEQGARRRIQELFDQRGLICEEEDGPWVAADHHTANPYHKPSPDYEIREGTWLLLDIWGREDGPNSVYHDLTFCVYVGREPPKAHQELFHQAAKARELVIARVEECFHIGRTVTGCELDSLCRGYLDSQGLGAFLKHRTGHSITTMAHGPGANLDSVYKPDNRPILPGTCFSVEPGIYTEDIGVRTEINVFVLPEGKPIVHAPRQVDIQCI